MRDPRVILLPPHVSPYGDFYQPPTDAQYEAMFRARVKANENRRKPTVRDLPYVPMIIAEDCAFFKRQI